MHVCTCICRVGQDCVRMYTPYIYLYICAIHVQTWMSIRSLAILPLQYYGVYNML